MKYKAEVVVELGDEDTKYIAGVTHYHHQPPDRNSWDSDVDYHGYTELEWELLNMDGTKAYEVEVLLSEREYTYIEDKILEEMEDCDEDR
jgi:hypothetical protein